MMMWLVVLVAIFFGLWLHAKLTCGKCNCPRERVSGKTVVITGGNRGIGRSCSIELVKGGANLIVGCRSTALAENLKAECAERNFKGTVRVLPLNLQSFASVREFVEKVKEITPTLDVLINNAGVGVPKETSKTEDGFEVTYQTNYLSPFLLTHLLLPIMKRDGGRIVNVSSVMHLMGSDLRLAKNKTCSEKVFYAQAFVYADTKLAMTYWTKALAKKLVGTGITVNCCHPGYVQTDIFSHTDRYKSMAILRYLACIYAKTPKEGAQPILHLVLSGTASTITGKYWADCSIVRFQRRPLKEFMSETVWKNSLKQCNVEDF